MPHQTEQEKRQELERLLDLKKKAEQEDLAKKEQAELGQLNKLHAQYASMQAKDMEQQLSSQFHPKPVPVAVKSSSKQDELIDDYVKEFSNRPGYKEPETKNGMTVLTFASEQEAGNFFLAQAQKHRGFRVYDKQMRLIAYSNGNGTLYHGNGDVFKAGDAFKPQLSVTKDNYRVPKPEPADVASPEQSTAPTPFKNTPR